MALNQPLTRWFSLLALAIMLLTSGVASAQTISTNYLPSITANTAQATSGTTYYVSKNGSNRDGRSWATAWNELSQINWSVVQPGDTVLLDGGATEMRYTTSLTLGKSGTADKPITIRLANEAGRNGKVVIFGGRSTPLPYCGQSNYTYQTSGVRTVAIQAGNAAYVIVDGSEWRGITAYGHNGSAVQTSSGAHHLTFRNLELYDNGQAIQSGGAWQPHTRGSSEGIYLRGSHITVERAIIHDNAADAIQSPGTSNFTLRQSWLYNARKAPNGDYFNRCTHQDGIQIHNGGTQSGVLLEDSIIGPGFLQGLILGEPGQATINNITARHVLFQGTDNAHAITHTTPARNWTFENVTTTGSVKGRSMTLYGSGHRVIQSRLDQRVYAPNNGVTVTPCVASRPCGSRVMSLQDIMNLGGTPAPQPPPQPTPAPTVDVTAWAASNGQISAPFVVENGVVSQAVRNTTPTAGGRAAYRIALTKPGSYVIKALVEAPTTGSNSLYLNIDGEPTGDTMVWDIDLTTGMQERTASWRGRGTVEQNEFRPKVFNLTAGEHTLIVRGREQDVRISKLWLEPVATTN